MSDIVERLRARQGFYDRGVCVGEDTDIREAVAEIERLEKNNASATRVIGNMAPVINSATLLIDELLRELNAVEGRPLPVYLLAVKRSFDDAMQEMLKNNKPEEPAP